MRRTVTVTISLPPRLSRQAERVMSREGRTRSELFREAMRRYLSDETDERLLRRELQAKARRLGVRTEGDVERIVDQMRR